MKRVSRCLLCAAASVLFQVATAPNASAASIALGADLATFAVLGATSVTNVPTSTITGSVGVSAGTSITGFTVGTDPQVTGGTVQSNTGTAADAQLQLDAAILALNSQGPGITLGTDLTGTILPGVYTVPAAATNLSGALILNGLGSNTASWVFLFPSTLITSPTSTVSVINVGDGSGVGIYWSVGTGATLNGPTFAGNVFAQTLISSDGNLTLSCGRLASAIANVTLIQDTIAAGCGGGGAGGGFTPPASASVPEPGTLVLMGAGIAGLVARRRRSARA